MNSKPLNIKQKKLSGSEFKKRRIEKEAAAVKNTKSITAYYGNKKG